MKKKTSCRASAFTRYTQNVFLLLIMMKLLQIVSLGRRRFSADFQLVFRLIKGLIFLSVVSVLITLIALPHMTFQDVIVCILAFMPTGWGLLLVRANFLLSYSVLDHQQLV